MSAGDDRAACRRLAAALWGEPVRSVRTRVCGLLGDEVRVECRSVDDVPLAQTAGTWPALRRRLRDLCASRARALAAAVESEGREDGGSHGED